MSLTKKESAFIRFARVAHLATADKTGQPHVIPICFVFDGTNFYSPIDEKPKRTTPHKLKRLRNIKANPKVSLVIDRYEDDWSKLGYILVIGKARVLLGGVRHRKAARLLRRKYPQYRRMAIDKRPIICVAPHTFRAWGDFF